VAAHALLQRAVPAAEPNPNPNLTLTRTLTLTLTLALTLALALTRCSLQNTPAACLAGGVLVGGVQGLG